MNINQPHSLNPKLKKLKLW